MTRYALVDAKGVILRFGSDEPNVDQSKLAPGKPRWLPVVEAGAQPAFDQTSQYLTGPTPDIQAKKVVMAWTVEDRTVAERKSTMTGQIARTREQKLLAGFDYDFGGARGAHHIGTTENDRRGWDDVSKLAQAAINLGSPDAEIVIDTDTGKVKITAMEWQSVLLAAGAAQQPIWQNSFALADAVEKAKTHAALDAINLDAGWSA